MTDRRSFPDWNWGNPDECTARLDAVRADSPWCGTLELDKTELWYAVGRAGFDPAAIRVRDFGQRERPDLAALDQPIRNDETIYIEASR